MVTGAADNGDQDLLEVVIIGAGPSGLIAAKHLRDICGYVGAFSLRSRSLSSAEADRSAVGDGLPREQSVDAPATQGETCRGRVAVFEETSSAGGIWNRDGGPLRPCIPCCCHDPGDGCDGALQNSSDDRTGLPKSIDVNVECSSQPVYEDLVTNLPKNIMSFSDLPFPSETPFFPPAGDVQNYYNSYVSHHRLDDETSEGGGFIKYRTRVDKCVRGKDGNWVIKTISTENGSHHNWRAMRLLVCNGHFRRAFVPDVQGARHLRARGVKLIHSSAFRSVRDEAYRDKRVLIVGGFTSGADIAAHLVRVCRRVVVSARRLEGKHRLVLKGASKGGASIRPGLNFVSDDGNVHFLPGSEMDGFDKKCFEPESFDVIIFATGYRYHYPFLPNEGIACMSGNDGFRMERLYKRILSIDDPTLAFIGTTNGNLSPAVVFEFQAQWYAHYVKGDLKPMQGAMEEEIQSRANDQTQDILLLQNPSYCNSLASMIPGAEGFWTQIVLRRAPLHIRSMIKRRHPCVFWIAAFGFPIIIALNLWISACVRRIIISVIDS